MVLILTKAIIAVVRPNVAFGSFAEVEERSVSSAFTLRADVPCPLRYAGFLPDGDMLLDQRPNLQG
jgi:hypothetical protein